MSIIIKELIIKSIVYEGKKENRNYAAVDRSMLKREIAKVCAKIVNDKFKKIKER